MGKIVPDRPYAANFALRFYDDTLIEKLDAPCRNYTYIQYVAIYIGLVRESLTNEKKSGGRLAFVYFVQTGQAQ